MELASGCNQSSEKFWAVDSKNSNIANKNLRWEFNPITIAFQNIDKL